MSIQGMREWVKGHRVVLGVLFGLLVLSLLLTYSISGLGNINGSQADLGDYSGFEQAITEEEAALKVDPYDYEANYNLANTMYEYASQLSQSGDEASITKSVEMYGKSATLFLSALQFSGDSFNALAKANIFTKAAKAYSVSGDDKSADEAYKAGIKQAPDDLETTQAYVQYLVYLEDYDGATAALADLLKNTQDEGTVASVNQTLEQIKSLQEGSAADTQTDAASGASKAE